MVTVFLSILNQMEIHLVQKRKEYCHHDHIPFNLKGNGNIVFSVYSNYDVVLKLLEKEFFEVDAIVEDLFESFPSLKPKQGPSYLTTNLLPAKRSKGAEGILAERKISSCRINYLSELSTMHKILKNSQRFQIKTCFLIFMS